MPSIQPAPSPQRPRRALGGLARGLLLGLLGLLGPLALLPPEPGTQPQPRTGSAWADEGGDSSSGDAADSADAGSDAVGAEDDAADAAEYGDEDEEDDDQKDTDEPAAAPAAALIAWDAVDDSDSGEHLAHELLALNPSATALAYLRDQTRIQVVEAYRLRALGLRVVRLRVLDEPARVAVQRLAQIEPTTFALQHLYALAQRVPVAAAPAPAPAPAPGMSIVQAQRAIGWPERATGCGRQQTIGIVDTEVQRQHPALAAAQVRSRRLLQPGQEAAQDAHGSAIAALLVGQTAGYSGLLPQARLYAAAPFYRLPSGQQRADALGLALSLDWLVQQGAQVIGMSLAGPRNPVLDAALERARARGVVVVAAMGNGGRAAPPSFPAAHPAALAVTALTPAQTVYRRASQGAHVRFALPGADIPTLGPDGALQRRSGTSFAVPFLLAMVSQSLHEGSLSAQQWFDGQGMALQDLGPPGRDPVFGWGLPTLRPRCR